MENQVSSLGSISLEGSSQIFVNSPPKRDSGFKEIFVDQSERQNPGPPSSGTRLHDGGNDKPAETKNAQHGTSAEDDWEPTFVTPPNEKSANAETEPVFVDTPRFEGEAYPVADLFDGEGTIDVFELTDADLAEPVEIEPSAVETAPVIMAQGVADDEATTTAWLSGLAALQAGQYGEPVPAKMPSQVEIAALNTRPFTQAIEAETADENAEIMPATSAVTTARMMEPASTVPATSSGSLPSAIRNAVRSIVETNPVDSMPKTAADDAEVIPATSAATLSTERLTELRQIQAYAENMTARTSDGSNSSNQAVDIAAMTTRLDKSNGPMAATHPTVHTAPQSLNFTEKGWESAFGRNIQWMSTNSIQSAQIRINPAELGPVQIDLRMNKDHLTLQINASHHITRDTLEAALPRLRSELADQGFANANIDMTDQGKGQQSGQQTKEQESPSADGMVRSSEENGDTVDIVPATSAINLMSGSISLLDTFA